MAMNFGFLTFNGVEELDLFGPWEMIALWSRHLNGPTRFFTVAESLTPVTCNMGTRLLPAHSFDNCPPLDYILIPGGEGTKAASTDPRLLKFVQAQAVRCKNILSVCTGSLVLHAAGLLSGQRATTHWGVMHQLRQCADVTVMNERFVQSGKIWTAAGVSAGIDMILAFIADQAGDEIAGKVQLYAEYYPSITRYGTAHLSAEAPHYLSS